VHEPKSSTSEEGRRGRGSVGGSGRANGTNVNVNGHDVQVAVRLTNSALETGAGTVPYCFRRFRAFCYRLRHLRSVLNRLLIGMMM
jgi:hypothetical protein